MSIKDYTEISSEVRKKVYERDSYEGATCCVLCGRPNNIHVHHVISRGRGGMGIEENLVCLCVNCHTYYHKTHDAASEDFMRRYLANKYPGWSEDKVIWRKK